MKPLLKLLLSLAALAGLELVASSPANKSTGSEVAPHSIEAQVFSFELNADGCGTWGGERIHNGDKAPPGSWPWQASLLRPAKGAPNRWSAFCGGALITRSHVLTAAHCLAEIKLACQLRLRLGSEPFDNIEASEPRPSDREVLWFGIHDEYNRSTFNNDIAILRLRDLPKGSDEPKVVCLPSALNENYIGREVRVTGNGLTSISKRSNELLQADLVVYENQRCEQTAGERPLFGSQICAGADDGSKDSCEGDSGGPLMVEEEDQGHILIGIVSYGPTPCGNRNRPGLYTRVSSYWKWIKRNTRN